MASGRFDSNEQHFPLDMFAGCCGPSAREGLVQYYKVADLINLRQKPVGKSATAGACNLPAQQLDGAVEDSVVVRFRQAILAMIDKPNHADALDRCPEPWVSSNIQNHFAQIVLVTPRDLFLWEICYNKIRSTEVRPIGRRRAISD